jgi:hypothetical protein
MRAGEEGGGEIGKNGLFEPFKGTMDPFRLRGIGGEKGYRRQLLREVSEDEAMIFDNSTSDAKDRRFPVDDPFAPHQDPVGRDAPLVGDAGGF